MPEQADWDIVSGAGLTALYAAAARGLASIQPDPLVHDPYAVAFVRAAVAQSGNQLASPLPETLAEAGRNPSLPWITLAGYLGVRSKFFDEFATGSARPTARQVVIMAAGLDTRAFRLGWSPDATVFEVEAPLILRFKDQVLDGEGARARCTRREVASDLREDWMSGLRQAGFDPEQPANWILEGLFPYLPLEAQESMLARMHQMSAPGSGIAIESISGTDLIGDSGIQEAMRRNEVDLSALWPNAEEHDPATWLGSRGWTVEDTPVTAVAERYGRLLSVSGMEALRNTVLLTAARD